MTAETEETCPKIVTLWPPNLKLNLSPKIATMAAET
jgi:hypothetical protein